MVAVRVSGEPISFVEEVSELLQRPARRDALPEHTSYADSGCDIHPSCLTCPLVRCRYDEPGGARSIMSAERDRTIIELQEQKMPINKIAARYGVSRRTVFRVLAKHRERGGHQERQEDGTWL